MTLFTIINLSFLLAVYYIVGSAVCVLIIISIIIILEESCRNNRYLLNSLFIIFQNDMTYIWHYIANSITGIASHKWNNYFLLKSFMIENYIVLCILTLLHVCSNSSIQTLNKVSSVLYQGTHWEWCNSAYRV